MRIPGDWLHEGGLARSGPGTTGRSELDWATSRTGTCAMPLFATIADPATLESLAGRVARLRVDARPEWGSMTAHQVLLHLTQGSESALGQRPFPIPDQAAKPLMKMLALYLPIPWPKNLKTGANPAGEPTVAERFEADRARAVEALEALAAAPSNGVRANHPIFGAMTLGDWHRWAYLHTDHHLRQYGL